MAHQASTRIRHHSAAPRSEWRRPVLALALGVAATVALGAGGPSLTSRIMSDVAAVTAAISQDLIHLRSHRGYQAAAEFSQSNSDEYVPQVGRIIRFPADEL